LFKKKSKIVYLVLACPYANFPWDVFVLNYDGGIFVWIN